MKWLIVLNGLIIENRDEEVSGRLLRPGIQIPLIRSVDTDKASGRSVRVLKAQ
jgi:hypothetical protein